MYIAVYVVVNETKMFQLSQRLLCEITLTEITGIKAMIIQHKYIIVNDDYGHQGELLGALKRE